MKPKILVGASSFGKRNPAPVELLESHGLEVMLNPYGRKLEKNELVELLTGVDGLLAGLETVDREVLESSALKVVSRCGSGISNVDVEACEELGIAFKFTPYGPTQAVAELTLGMMLALLRQAFFMHKSLSKGNWNKRVGFQLKDKKICIVGYGRIGRRTAKLLAPFEVEILAVDPFVDASEEGVRVMKLHDALPLADIVVLHLSGEELILGPEEFSSMKNGSYLCNAARGQNIDEDALLEALENGKLAGAWLDSFCKEPYNGALCSHPMVLLTPHVGSYTAEGRLEMEMEAAQNLVEALVGGARG